MIYALPYCIVTILIFSLTLIPKQAGIVQYKFLPRYSIIVFLLFFIGCRGFIVTDWVSYYPYYKKVPSVFDSSLSKFLNSWQWEKGFLLYSSILKTISSNYFVFQFISFFIDLVILDKIFREYVDFKYYGMAFLLFFVFQGFVIEVNLLRNSKAFMIFLLSLKYVRQRNPIKYFFMIFLACLFHISSVIYFPVYFILEKHLSKKVLLILFFLGNFIYFFHIEWIARLLNLVAPVFGNSRIGIMLNSYGLISGKFSSYSFGIGFFERSFTFFMALKFYDKVENEKRDIVPFFNVLFIFIFIYLYFAEVGILVERITLLFVWGYPIVYPFIYSRIKRRDNKFVFLFATFVYAILKMIIQCDEPNYAYTNALIEYQDYVYRKSIIDKTIKNNL